MKPSIGRIVHYQSYGTPGGEYLPEPRAAIITAVDSQPPEGARLTGEAEWYYAQQRVSLCVLNPEGLFFNHHVKYAEEPTPGCWNWPPKV